MAFRRENSPTAQGTVCTLRQKIAYLDESGGLLLILILHTKFKGWQRLVWLPSKINSGYKRINHGIYFHISMFQFGNKI